jgi:hypothetical protein
MKTTTVPLAEIRQHRLGLRIAAQLSAGTDDLPHDVQERLRAAREQALAHRKRPVTVTAPQSAGHAVVLGQTGGAAVLGGFGHFGANHGLNDDRAPWWSSIVSVVAGLALIAGLIVINVVQSDEDTAEVASVDTALLTDDLPPLAYADPGFAQFLKSGAPPAATPAPAPASN